MKPQQKALKSILKGVIKRHPDGFGFFIPDLAEHPDVYIPAHSMKGAMTNDRVSIYVEKERDGRFRGDIIRIEERSIKKIAGKYTVINDRYGAIKDEGKGWGMDLRIPLENSMSAKSGDLVAARIESYPDSGSFSGSITEIIGDPMSALNDIRRVIINQNIPDQFSSETLAEAKKLSPNPTEADFKNRKDLRTLPLITIDGATAKDFDDAVYVEMTKSGFHLYVAIADVSHYVKKDTAMDKDAYERGTSVYFPNFVVPMLPEALSNGLCSLNPRVPRLSLVAEMHFDFSGQMMTSNFFEAVIESKARVTYGEAQEIVDGNDIPAHTSVPGVKQNILHCADLAKVLMAKRFKEGSLDLEVPETVLEIDGSGEPIDVIKSERLFAHRLIEELMLAANVAVAKYLGSKDIPSMYRIHEPPDPLKVSLLQKFLNSMGSKANLSGEKLQKKLTRALQEFSNESQAQVIHILTLRSMSQAKYTTENVGHFGLGFDHYTHFTSPIRRYPDLIVHRLIKNQLNIPGYRLTPEDELQTAGTWLSACEQRSAKSERQIQAIKKARFVHKMLGQSFEGLISSVTKFGIFVLLKQYNVDGLVKLDDLQPTGAWEFDEENLTLTNKKTKFSFGLGESVRVTVSSVDIEQGQINFVLEGAQPRSESDTKSPRSFKSRGRNKPAQQYNEKSSRKEFNPGKAQTPDTTSSTIKPRYSSLAEYLEKNAKYAKNNSHEKSSHKGDKPKQQGRHTEKRADKFSEKQSATKASANRSNSEKRSSTKNDSIGFGKARPKKSHRKNKSR